MTLFTDIFSFTFAATGMLCLTLLQTISSFPYPQPVHLNDKDSSTLILIPIGCSKIFGGDTTIEKLDYFILDFIYFLPIMFTATKFELILPVLLLITH